MGVVDTIKDVIGASESTYTYECHQCGTEFETTDRRHEAECPECGGPPATTWQE
jgi:rRNA maturation endonuclease Nob1